MNEWTIIKSAKIEPIKSVRSASLRSTARRIGRSFFVPSCFIERQYSLVVPKTPISIAETVVHGVAFDPKNSERVAQMDLNELFASVGRLFDLLEEREIDYVLAGGIAMLSYVEGRNTQDVDLVLAESELSKLPELRVEDRNETFARCWLGDLRVDLLFAENEPFKLVSEQLAIPRGFADRSVPCASEEGLLLMKLFALPSLYRQARFERVAIYESDLMGLISLGTGATERVWKLLEKLLLESDVEELRKIVADIENKLRGQRFGDDKTL